MNLYTTQIQAIDFKDGQIKTWNGPNVPGLTQQHAEQYCEENGLGYCKVTGKLIAIIEGKEKINYELSEFN